MIHKKRFLKVWVLAFTFPILLSSCSNDELEGTEPGVTSGNGGNIEFAIDFAPQSRVATDAVFSSSFEDGDEIGIFAVTSGTNLSATASGNYIHNVRLTYNGTSWNLDNGVELWWPSSGGKLDFYAYHPYDTKVTDPTAIEFNVLPNQSSDTNNKSNYSLSDLLTAKTTQTGGYGKGETVPLTFSHALAMVQVSIPVEGKGFGPSNKLTVTLREVNAGATLNLGAMNTTLFTGNDPVSITMQRVEEATNTTHYTYRALLPAQEVEQGSSLFLFEHEGRQLFRDGELKTKLVMTAGKAETFERMLPQAVHTVSIFAGTFLMGSSNGSATSLGKPGDPNCTPAEPGRDDDEIQHEVTLAKDFYMSKYPVTNVQFAAFLNAKGVQGETLTHPYGYGNMTGGKCTWGANDGQHLVYEGDSGYQWGISWKNNEWVPQEGYANHPVVWVTWYGATEYAAWAGGSLPTEAQWEYACRGGEENRPFGIGSGYVLNNTLANFDWTYSWEWDGSSAAAVMTNTGSYPASTQIVGSYSPNSYGLYDMHGNVWEWCSDRYGSNYYSNSPSKDPTGPDSGSYRVLRGGDWSFNAQCCRSAFRYYDDPDFAYDYIGFRVVFVP